MERSAERMMDIAQLQTEHIEDAKRVIATVVLEFYFDGFTVDQLLEHYSKIEFLSDIDSLQTAYDGKNGTLLGVFDQSRLVGVGGAKKLSDDTGELVRLWLMPSYRNRGLGRRVVEMLLHFAKREGLRSLKLDTSRKCVDAIALFNKVGFQEVKPYKESIGDCFMELDLHNG
jgi:ribosomal protein S18 acetylase RimI-like enzyme